MLKGVFFDLFGTLLVYCEMQKAWEDWLLALYKNFKKCGLKISQKSFALECDGIMSKPEPITGEEHLTVYEKRLFSLGFKLNLKLESENIRKMANDSINAWQKYVPLDPDAISVLKVLKERKSLALITNFDHPPFVYSLLSDMKLRDFFDSIVISGEVGVKKPNPLIFSFALKKINLQPKEVCYIGDTEDDMKAARSAKIYPILIRRKNHLDSGKVDDYNLDRTYNKIEKKIEYSKKIANLKELITII